MSTITCNWINVEERLPDMKLKTYPADGAEYLESDYVLVWDGVKIEIAQLASDKDGVCWFDRCADVVKAISWMPLPTPPSQIG